MHTICRRSFFKAKNMLTVTLCKKHLGVPVIEIPAIFHDHLVCFLQEIFVLL